MSQAWAAGYPRLLRLRWPLSTIRVALPKRGDAQVLGGDREGPNFTPQNKGAHGWNLLQTDIMSIRTPCKFATAAHKSG